MHTRNIDLRWPTKQTTLGALPHLPLPSTLVCVCTRARAIETYARFANERLENGTSGCSENEKDGTGGMRQLSVWHEKLSIRRPRVRSDRCSYSLTQRGPLRRLPLFNGTVNPPDTAHGKSSVLEQTIFRPPAIQSPRSSFFLSTKVCVIIIACNVRCCAHAALRYTLLT